MASPCSISLAHAQGAAESSSAAVTHGRRQSHFGRRSDRWRHRPARDLAGGLAERIAAALCVAWADRVHHVYQTLLARSGPAIDRAEPHHRHRVRLVGVGTCLAVRRSTPVICESRFGTEHQRRPRIHPDLRAPDPLVLLASTSALDSTHRRVRRGDRLAESAGHGTRHPHADLPGRAHTPPPRHPRPAVAGRSQTRRGSINEPDCCVDHGQKQR